MRILKLWFSLQERDIDLEIPMANR